jgi:hypothetical protein
MLVCASHEFIYTGQNRVRRTLYVNVTSCVEVKRWLSPDVIVYFRPHEQFERAQDHVSRRMIIGLFMWMPESFHLRERIHRLYTR